jgi:hypothetical protein
VDRAAGRLRNALASLLGLPEAGSEVPVHLQVVVEDRRERWIRDFQGDRVETAAWAWRDLLLESLGWTSFASALVLDGSRLRYEFRRAWFAGIPIPRRLSLSVESYVDAGDAGWRVVVAISVPYLGQLLRYEGWIEPE